MSDQLDGSVDGDAVAPPLGAGWLPAEAEHLERHSIWVHERQTGPVPLGQNVAVDDLECIEPFPPTFELTDRRATESDVVEPGPTGVEAAAAGSAK